MMNYNQTAQVQLSALYSRNRSPVAYLDESYREPHEADEQAFYVITAVLCESEGLADLREEFLDEVGGTWWHTVEMFRDGHVEKVKSFIELLTTQAVSLFVTVQAEVQSGKVEQARRQCLLQLLVFLESRDCRLVVMEARQNRKANNSDSALVSRAVSDGLLSRQLKLFHASPSIEPLLWAPDLACWAVRRFLALGDTIWLERFQRKPMLLNLGSASLLQELVAVKPKKPEPAAASGSGSEPSVDLYGEEKERSSLKSMPQEEIEFQGLLTLFGEIVKPPLKTEYAWSWLENQFGN